MLQLRAGSTQSPVAYVKIGKADFLLSQLPQSVFESLVTGNAIRPWGSTAIILRDVRLGPESEWRRQGIVFGHRCNGRRTRMRAFQQQIHRASFVL